MKKSLVFTIIIAVLGSLIYYTKIYTYFLNKEIAEEMPQKISGEKEEEKILKDGQFQDADFFHKGSGSAKIISYAWGKNILRFENFDITNGPDLFVYLSPSATPGRNIESLGNFLDLGILKGNQGNQNYDLPQGIDFTKYKSVVVWCKQFGALFPYAIFKQ